MMGILAALMLLALILSFETVAAAAGNAINVPGDVVKAWARIVLGVLVGIFLINAGIAALSVPFIGITFIIVGVVLVGFSAWPVVKKIQDG